MVPTPKKKTCPKSKTTGGFFPKKNPRTQKVPKNKVIFFIVHSRRRMIPFDGRDFITSMGKFGNANKLPLDAKLDANSVGSQVSHRNE